MRDLLGLSLAETRELAAAQGLAAHKGRELFRFINQKLGADLNDLTVLTKEERARLNAEHWISRLEVAREQQSRDTIKAAFRLADGLSVEAVFMDYREERKTVCVSAQAGCPIGCLFCATGRMGPGRNLTAAEILGQIYHFARQSKVSNLVFMGMGEPFLNYDNVLKAIGILNIETGLNIAARKIVVSTIGIIAGIEKFAGESKQLRLAWSLVAPFDELRRKLINYPQLPSIKETIRALDAYQQKTKRRITIEYVLLKDMNDGDAEVAELGKICSSLDCHLNLIPYNPSPNLPFERADVEQFWRKFKKASPRVNVTVRQSFGREIAAACGQLSTLLK